MILCYTKDGIELKNRKKYYVCRKDVYMLAHLVPNTLFTVL